MVQGKANAHDIMDRVTNISWRTTSGATLGGFAYEYDALGRITSRSYTLGTNAFDRVYTYDDFDRLATDGDVAYTYDAAGNRRTRTENDETITYTLGVGDRLASYGRAASTMPPHSGAYTHDAAGNVTRIERDGRPTLDLVWNSQYQLVSVSTNGVFAESYAYDAPSRRVSTTTLEGTTRHVYDDNWQCIADINLPGDIDPRHREIFFDDGMDSEDCPAHVGYGPSGVHKDSSNIPYNNSERGSYDDARMRAAVKAVVGTGKWKGSDYNVITHNCQDCV